MQIKPQYETSLQKIIRRYSMILILTFAGRDICKTFFNSLKWWINYFNGKKNSLPGLYKPAARWGRNAVERGTDRFFTSFLRYCGRNNGRRNFSSIPSGLRILRSVQKCGFYPPNDIYFTPGYRCYPGVKRTVSNINNCCWLLLVKNVPEKVPIFCHAPPWGRGHHFIRFYTVW